MLVKFSPFRGLKKRKNYSDMIVDRRLTVGSPSGHSAFPGAKVQQIFGICKRKGAKGCFLMRIVVGRADVQIRFGRNGRRKSRRRLNLRLGCQIKTDINGFL